MSPPRDNSHFGVGNTKVILRPSWNTCNRSIVLEAEDGVSEGSGGCDTIVVFTLLSKIVAFMLVEEIRLAGTDLYVVVSLTVMSKRPEGKDVTRTVESGESTSSDLNEMVRS